MRTVLTKFLPLFFLLAVASAAGGQLSAQTDTPEPPPAPTAAPDPYRYEEFLGQSVRYEYIITAGDVAIAGLLIALVLTSWVGLALLYIGRRRD